MKKYIYSISLTVVGFAIGVIFMGFLSMKASKIYIQTFRINYLIEQEFLAVKAQKDGDLNKALIHYNNLLYGMSAPEIRLVEEKSKWSFFFPFASFFLQELWNVDSSKINQTKIEGINRGKVALILDKLGRKNEAEEQYQIAITLTGIKDINKLKEIIKDIQEKTIQN